MNLTDFIKGINEKSRPLIEKTKEITLEEFYASYHDQIQRNGKAIYYRIRLKDQSGSETGLESLKNIEFIECLLQYQTFGKPVSLEDKANEKTVRKLYENITFKDCVLYDVSMNDANFVNLAIDNSSFLNNCSASECSYKNMQISGNADTIMLTAYWPFFKDCKFKDCVLNDKTVQPSFLRQGNDKKESSPYSTECIFDNVKFADKEASK